MPKKWEYTGSDGRDFPYPQALTVQPGDVVEASENPDPAFFKQYQPGATAEKTDEKE